jgi:MFS family permease
MLRSVRVSPEAPSRAGLARLPFYYGWVQVAVAALAMTATLPGRSNGLGLIKTPLQDSLEIDSLRFDTFNFVAILLGAAFCWPIGWLLDRLGARVVLTGVAAALGVAVVAMSRVNDPAPLLLTLTLVRGLGQGALSVVSMALVGKWFTRRLGTAMGVFTVLLAPGFIVGILSVGGAVQAYGWRQAWLGLGLALLFVMAPLSWLLVRRSPEACGLAPDHQRGSGDSAARPEPCITLRAALLTPTFWLFSLAACWFALAWSAVTLSNQAILEEHGFDYDAFLLAMAMLTASGLPSNLLGGWLARRWPMGRLLAIGMAFFAASLLVFPLVHSRGSLMAYSLLLGAAGGVITVVFFTVYGHAFGRRHLGRIQGAAQVLTVIASAVGPLILEGCKNWRGSYDLFFLATAIVAALLGLTAWFVRVTSPTGLESETCSALT